MVLLRSARSCLRQVEVGDRIPVLETLHIQPVLLGRLLVGRACRLDLFQLHVALERGREDSGGVGLSGADRGAVRKRDSGGWPRNGPRDVPRFRPNVEVSPTDGSDGFVENAWLGRIIAITEHVRLKIDLSCARCVMTTLAQGDLPRDPGILRTAAQHNHVKVGVYASVLRGGKIQRGDSIRLE